MKLEDKHFKKVEFCPWCNAPVSDSSLLYYSDYECGARRCSCGFVFADKVLNSSGLKMYWDNYESNVHIADKTLTDSRKKMYQLESNFINKFLKPESRIFDVGCAGGEFLDVFKTLDSSYECSGCEFGDEAYQIASKKYNIYKGEFPDLNIKEKYDLVIFRGTIQYFSNPKSYIKKAFEILRGGGLLYITSSPNAESVCFNLFKEFFSLPVKYTNIGAFSEKILTEYILKIGGSLYQNYFFYKETPYCDIENDIKRVADAIEDLRCGRKITKKSPPFFDNMLSLVYRKETQL